MLFAALALTLLVRRRREFAAALASFFCLVGTQVLFWLFTFPANRVTQNWTVLPEHWMALRVQWEYSHAASALLNLAALVALIVACLAAGVPSSPHPSRGGAHA